MFYGWKLKCSAQHETRCTIKVGAYAVGDTAVAHKCQKINADVVVDVGADGDAFCAGKIPVCVEMFRTHKHTIFSDFSSGISSMRFRECTQNRLRPMEKGLHRGSATTLSPA